MADFQDVIRRMGPTVEAQVPGNEETLRRLLRQARRGWQDFLAMSRKRYDREQAGEDTTETVRVLLIREQEMDRLDAQIRLETARLERSAQ